MSAQPYDTEEMWPQIVRFVGRASYCTSPEDEKSAAEDLLRYITRHVRLAEREAAAWALALHRGGVSGLPTIRDTVNRAYPLPIVTREVVREEPDPHGTGAKFRVRLGRLQGIGLSVLDWSDAQDHEFDWAPTPERVALWDSLYKQPTRTETVEDTGEEEP